MPRIARALADNCFYHTINRGNGRQQVFHKDGDYRAFIGVTGKLAIGITMIGIFLLIRLI